MSFKTLSWSDKCAFVRRLLARREAYEAWGQHGEIADSKRILVVGDRPGPRAPQTNEHHHTPFYSTFGSGGWLTEQLLIANISEDEILFINSASWDGVPTSRAVLERQWDFIFALGNNAAKWVKAAKAACVKFDHPQYHKRFAAKSPYPLIAALAAALSS